MTDLRIGHPSSCQDFYPGGKDACTGIAFFFVLSCAECETDAPNEELNFEDVMRTGVEIYRLARSQHNAAGYVTAAAVYDFAPDYIKQAVSQPEERSGSMLDEFVPRGSLSMTVEQVILNIKLGSGAVFTAGAFSIGIARTAAPTIRPTYWLFDSHATDEDGYLDTKGTTSTLISSINARALSEYIQERYTRWVDLLGVDRKAVAAYTRTDIRENTQIPAIETTIYKHLFTVFSFHLLNLPS
jgi:hypothetical protein